MDTSGPKLTKKQKKAVAFRDRKSKGKSTDEPNDVPEHDLLPDDEEAYAPIETPAPKKRKLEKPKAVAPVEPAPAPSEKPTKKRKREAEKDESAVDTATVPKKKRKAEDGAAAKPRPGKDRFLLFLGNLKYTTSLEAINEHFSKCDPPPQVRLLTPKPIPGKAANKSKGCAFLEFSHRNALQQGLKLHHSELDGRVVNVELTAGGGGKGESRTKKVAERNKDLLDQRTKQAEKAQKEGLPTPSTSQKPQRYSSTSGAEHAPKAHRTWTVGGAEDGQTHRGGQKHIKPSKAKNSRWSTSTGPNAVPLGAR